MKLPARMKVKAPKLAPKTSSSSVKGVHQGQSHTMSYGNGSMGKSKLQGQSCTKC